MHRPPLACGPQPVVARIALSPLCRRWERSSLPLAGWCMNVCVHESMCVCVCERERERERERVCMYACMNACQSVCVYHQPRVTVCIQCSYVITMALYAQGNHRRVHPLPLCALYAKVNHLRVHPLRAGRACTRALWRKGACRTLLCIHAYVYMARLE